jgi:hypothetical protein
MTHICLPTAVAYVCLFITRERDKRRCICQSVDYLLYFILVQLSVILCQMAKKRTPFLEICNFVLFVG